MTTGPRRSRFHQFGNEPGDRHPCCRGSNIASDTPARNATNIALDHRAVLGLGGATLISHAVRSDIRPVAPRADSWPTGFACFSGCVRSLSDSGLPGL